jgi:tetratricopeptide (TPR) repeat protein
MQPQPRYHVGDKIGGRYLVHQALMGGMGEVYLCLDLETIQPFALKTFQQRYLTNPKLRAAFENEVVTWVTLEKHPNIVRCFYMDIIDNQPFMFLEWIASDESWGTDLRSWLRHGPLDLRLALDFTIDICRGLIHAGQKQPGIVHRDLKPENILVAQGRLAKITDWGLAKIVQEAELEITEGDGEAGGRQSLLGASSIVGTPAYMAPEQWRGGMLDWRTDIYAIGCILYEMLSGQLPFKASTPEGFRTQHLQSPIPTLTGAENLPSALDTVLVHCLSKRNVERSATVDDILQELSFIYRQRFFETPRAIATSGELTALDYTSRGATYERLQRYNEALADHNRAIRLDPNLALAYLNRGATYQRLQRFVEALADYTHAIQRDPTYALAYSNRGATYEKLQRYDEALMEYTRAIQLRPTFVRAYVGRGNTYAGLRHYDEALADYTHAIELDLSFVDAYVGRGLTYDSLRHYDRALADHNRAIQLDPTCILAYNNRGITYAKLRQYDRALADHNRAIQLDPTFAWAYYNRGNTHAELQSYDEALADFTRAMQLDPAFAQAYYNRGVIYERLQRYDEALADYTRAVQLDPASAQAYNNRGAIHERLQYYDEALMDYTRAVQLDPALALAHLNIGALLANRGMLLDALAHFEKAAQLRLPQGAHYAAQVRTRLAIETFQQAGSPDEIRHGVAQFPFMADAEFIAAIEQTVAQRVPLEHQPALNQRLAWLRQIAEEQKREARDQ